MVFVDRGWEESGVKMGLKEVDSDTGIKLLG
jgi:hypothetical protein